MTTNIENNTVSSTAREVCIQEGNEVSPQPKPSILLKQSEIDRIIKKFSKTKLQTTPNRYKIILAQLEDESEGGEYWQTLKVDERRTYILDVKVKESDITNLSSPSSEKHPNDPIIDVSSVTNSHGRGESEVEQNTESQQPRIKEEQIDEIEDLVTCEQAYLCSGCEEVFTSEQLLIRHQLTEHSDVRLQCFNCSQVIVGTREDVAKHIIMCKKRADIELSTCDSMTEYKSQSTEAGNTELDGEDDIQVASIAEFSIEIRSSRSSTLDDEILFSNLAQKLTGVESNVRCKIIDAVRQHLRRKVLRESRKPCEAFVCDKCGKKFDLHRSLMTHLKSHDECVCSICGLILKNKRALERHEKYHSETPKEIIKYPCEKCDKVFIKKSAFEKHLVRHSLGHLYMCDRCGMQYDRYQSFQVHRRIGKCKERVHVCDVCNKGYKNSSALRVHKESHLDVESRKKYTCEQCGKCFLRKSMARDHARLHTGEKPFVCSMCNKSFHALRNLRQHVEIHSSLRPFQCNLCGVSFKRQGNLASHWKRHGSAPIICEICGKTFHNPSSFKHHMQNTHEVICDKDASSPQVKIEEEEKYTCDFCGQNTMSKQDMEFHLTSHAGMKSYLCHYCGRGFNSKVSRNSHHRLHTGDKTFSCSECGKWFTTKGSLKVHSIIHSGERPFPCEYCKKRFRRRDQLEAHVRTHTGQKPFVCDVCNRGFAQKTDCVKHKMRHTKQKPFACQFCAKTFFEARLLDNHTRIQHSDRIL